MDSLNEIVPVSSVRVYLLIEGRLLREALSRLFRKRPDLLVVGQSGRSETAPRQVLETRCDVLVADSCQEGWLPASVSLQNGGSAGFKTVLIGMEPDAEQFLDAVRSGVAGYLLPDASASD